MKLSKEYYQQADVLMLARDLLGKVLFTKIDNKITAGVITETEAYEGITDRASHAYNGKRTPRNEQMYNDGGTAYVYLCYGIHFLFNVVTNTTDIPHAILIRGIQPMVGLEEMVKRRKLVATNKALCSGPGKVSQALGIHLKHNGNNLLSDKIWIENQGIYIPESNINVTPRIGVEYAGEAAAYPYRFVLEMDIRKLN